MTGGTHRLNVGWLRSYTIAYLIFIYLPVFFLPLFSFNDGIYVAFPMKGFTLRWWEELMGQTGMLKALKNSFVVALPVAVISTALGLSAAKALTGYKLVAAALGESHPDTLFYLERVATLYAQEGRWEDADAMAGWLLELTPESAPEYPARRALVNQIGEALSGEN